VPLATPTTPESRCPGNTVEALAVADDNPLVFGGLYVLKRDRCGGSVTPCLPVMATLRLAYSITRSDSRFALSLVEAVSTVPFGRIRRSVGDPTGRHRPTASDREGILRLGRGALPISSAASRVTSPLREAGLLTEEPHGLAHLPTADDVSEAVEAFLAQGWGDVAARFRMMAETPLRRNIEAAVAGLSNRSCSDSLRTSGARATTRFAVGPHDFGVVAEGHSRPGP